MHQKTVLSNGLRVLSSTMPHTQSVSVDLFIGAGSRYEDDAHGGIFHLIEHMLFKGTRSRPNPSDISTAIESVGGLLNASTDREMTMYWAKVARPHFTLAFDLLADMVLNPLLNSEELTREKSVVLEELNMSNDSPASRVDILIDELLWPDQAMGRDIGGTKESVRGLTREMVVEYIARQYLPSNAVVSVVGNISHVQVVQAAERALDSWQPGTPLSWWPVIDSQTTPRARVEYRKTDQAHLCIAVKGLPLNHPNRYALGLLSTILGEGMSSRLFVELREKRALAYEVHSVASHYRDCGALIVYCGVDPKRVQVAVSLILEEVGRLREGVLEQELHKAKEMVKGRLLLRMEDSRAVAGWLGSQEFLLEEVLTPDQVVAKVQGVTTQEVQQVAEELLVSQKLSMALVGPFRDEDRFRKLLKL